MPAPRLPAASTFNVPASIVVLPTKVLVPVKVNTLLLEVSLAKTVLPTTPPPMTPLKVCAALELYSNSGLFAPVVPSVMVPA